MRKRILLIALALILALTCVFLASCKPTPPDNSSSSSSGDPGSSSGDPNNPQGTAAAVDNVRYLRVAELKDGKATLKFNTYVSGLSYDIRYSDKPITEENFESATKANASISGSGEITAVINDLGASLTKAYYVAVRPYVGNESNHGLVLSTRVGGNMLIPINYTSSIYNVYHGETLRGNFTNLFDEQDDKFVSSLYRPETNMGTVYPPPTKGDRVTYEPNSADVTDGKVGMTLGPIVDMEFNHYITTIKLYYGELKGKYIVKDNKVVFDNDTAFSGTVTVRWSKKPVDFQSENDAWDGYYEFEMSDIDDKNWNDVEVNAEARYVQVRFSDGEAPNEIVIYGYQSSENTPIATTLRPLPTMGEMMGMCGFVANGGGNTPIRSVSCTTVLREYHNFGWSYNDGAYPGMSNNFQGGMGSFDAQYSAYQAAGINVIPCVQWPNYELAKKVDDDGNPIKEDGKYVAASFFEKFNPQVYCLYADNMFCFAARYGSNTSADLLSIMRKHCSTAAKSAGAGTLQWIEAGNEPNGEDNLGMVPYQLAALQSACYDGHMKTLVSSKSDEGYHFGVKNADPNFKIAMAGLAGTGGRYITSMCYWLQANRTDGNLGMDAFNFHSYFSNTFYMNNSYIQVGVSPEYYNIVDDVSRIIEYRNKYFPDVEVWITEFGWDTNPSYETMTAAHAYGKYDSHQVQAMWLVRAYLLFSSIGIDKATMYMCEDVAYDVTAVGKYGTCGVIGFDEDGDEYCKDSYYYLYTLKNALGDYTFVNEIDSGSDDVWIYQYKNADGKTAYAVWCPTMDGTEVENFELKINGSSATLIEAVDLDTDGVSSELTVSNGAVKIHVSENPVYVMVD